MEKLEWFVDKLIPYLIIVLFGIVIVDVFYHETSVKYHSTIFVLDAIIITVFVIDLLFKYQRVRNIPRFLRLYWIDILAVFPFFLALRLFEEILLLSESSISALRNLFHVGLIFEEQVLIGEETVKTAELIAKEGRISLVERLFRPLRRLPRLFKAFSFYEHPEHNKTLYHKKK